MIDNNRNSISDLVGRISRDKWSVSVIIGCLTDVFNIKNVEELSNFSRERLASAIELRPVISFIENILKERYQLELAQPTECDIEMFNTGPHYYARRVVPGYYFGCCGQLQK